MSNAPPIIVATPNSVNPTPSATGRHQSVRSTRPSTMPAQKNASHGSSGCVRLTNRSSRCPRGELLPGLNSQLVACPPSLSLGRPTTRSPSAATALPAPMAMIDGRGQREDERGHEEHRAVERQDRPRPDLVVQLAESPQQQSAPDQRPPACRDGSRVADRAAGEQRDADAGGEHERRREAGAERAGPRVELAAPEVRRLLAAVDDEVAVEVHQHDADERDRAHDVRARRAATRGAPARPDRRTRPGWAAAGGSSLPDHLVDADRDQRSLDVDDVAGLRAHGTVRDEDERRVHVWSFDEVETSPHVVERAPPVGERLDAVGRPGPDDDEVSVGRTPCCRGIRRSCLLSRDGSRSHSRRDVAPPCRRATDRCRSASGSATAASAGTARRRARRRGGSPTATAAVRRDRAPAGERPARPRSRRAAAGRRRRAEGGCCSRPRASPASRT